MPEKTETDVALEPQATIPLTVLRWWRELVDHPQDLAPRMDAVIKRLEAAE